MRVKRKRVDVNLEELDRVLDHAREAPLSEPDYDKLKEALHALVGMLPHHAPRRRPAPCFRQQIHPRSRPRKSPKATGATVLRLTRARRKSPCSSHDARR